MRMRKYTAFIFALFLCLLLLPASVVNAEEYEDSSPDDYITKYFDVDVEFDSSHRATVTETINVDFIQPHHGITRVIPKALDSTYEIEEINADDRKFSVEESDENYTIRIGDANRTLTGEQAYVVRYQIQYFEETDASADFLAQNMLPTEWDTSIRESVLTLTMPEEIDWDGMYIYAGEYGADDAYAWTEHFDGYIDGNTMVLEGSNLPRGYGLTLRDTALPDGYWSQAVSFLDLHRGRVVAIVIVAVILTLLTAFLWYKYGRDEDIVETVEFYPPEGMTPAELGYAIDEDLEDNEMMTTVLYLADKGYISIRPDDEDFVFEKQKDAGEDEPRYIKTFLDGMFDKRQTFKTKKVPVAFRKHFDEAKTQLMEDYAEKHGEVVTENSGMGRLACILFNAINMAAYTGIMEGRFDGAYLAFFPVVISTAVMVFAWTATLNLRIDIKKNVFKILAATLAFALQVGLVLMFFNNYPKGLHYYVFIASSFLIFFFSLIMEKRSEKNAALIGKTYGFAGFIRDAEYDRLVALSEEDPQYYYHILPYAAVLGMETAWSKRFENIKIPQPDWYLSHGAFVYTSTWCDHMISSCTRGAVPSAPASSGGSSGGYSGGHSGGGFSGGGGGGGGGGGW
ncbi:MAG: DUF2207 domain-containing protein [Lachnospiraceae bacterium]|nr:DUF2207 domain-containing protein [Lachnospiraceae bacterium]